jgi:hypothetical protein
VDAKLVAGYGRIAGKFPFPGILRPAKSGSQQPRLFTSGFSLLAFHFKLLTSGFPLKLFWALLETTNRFDS